MIFGRRVRSPFSPFERNPQMRKLYCTLTALLLSLLLSGCGAPSAPQPETLTVACTTCPVYLLAQAVSQGVDTVEPVLVVDQQLSCLHDYTLTMGDMKTIEGSSLLAINGAGMEEFLEDVLESRTYLDCSRGLDLLWNEEEEENDPHFWLDPSCAAQMAENLARGLGEADPDHADTFTANAEAVSLRLNDLQQELKEALSALPCRQLITFHDGFSYFARAFDLEIAASVEEEEGSEASARRITELVALIDQYHIPAVFTETNGPDSTAKALAQERDIRVGTLNMGMSSDSLPEGLTGLEAYEWVIRSDVNAILEAYA